MATLFGFTINKKICRACLTFDESISYCKMKRRKRYFTHITKLPVDSSHKNWLCIQCARKISNMLAFYDKVIKINKELYRISSSLKDGSKLSYTHIEESRKIANFCTLTRSEISIYDNINHTESIQSKVLDNLNSVKTEVINIIDSFENLQSNFVENLENQEFGDNEDCSTSNELEQSINMDTEEITNKNDSDPIGLSLQVNEFKFEQEMYEDQTNLNEETMDNVADLKLSYLERRAARCHKVKVITLSFDQQIEEQQQLAYEKSYLNAVYKCTICFKGFSYEETYKKHMDTHDEGHGKYKCDVCSKYIRSHGSYRSHLANHSRRYECTKCDFTRAWRTPVAEHYDMVHEAKIPLLMCSLCGREFLKKTQLQYHMRYTHKECGWSKCLYCAKIFKTLESLRRHIATLHSANKPESTKRFPCPICGVRFHNSTFLTRHQIKHSTDRNYYCVDCNIYFKSELFLKTHLKSSLKHRDQSQLIACDQCPYKAANDKELTRHKNAKHHKITNYQCSECPSAFYANNSFRRHCRETHEGYTRPRIHVCDVCGKTFAVKSILDCHRNTHTGEKPYECKECEARFAGSGALYTHVKLVHRKMKRDAKGRFLPPTENVNKI